MPAATERAKLDRQMVDAIREILGLDPLYPEDQSESVYGVEVELASKYGSPVSHLRANVHRFRHERSATEVLPDRDPRESSRERFRHMPRSHHA